MITGPIHPFVAKAMAVPKAASKIFMKFLLSVYTINCHKLKIMAAVKGVSIRASDTDNTNACAVASISNAIFAVVLVVRCFVSL